MGRSGIGGGSSRGGGGGGHRGSMGRSSSSGRSGISSGRGSYRHSYGGYTPRYRTYGYGYRPTSISFLTLLVIMVAVFVLFKSGFRSTSITPSTVDRDPLPSGAVIETEYYTDNLFWIDNSSKLESGMKHFYKETGIQPYLYITDEVDGSRNPSAEQLETFSNSLYNELFEDEAHLLLVFQDADGHYSDWVITGTQAKQVADTEAVNILLDYVDRYYYDANLSEAEVFGKAFEKAADRMMTKTANPTVIIVVALSAVAIVAVAGIVIVKKVNQKKQEAEQMERLLNMDLNDGNTAENPEVTDLANKYK